MLSRIADHLILKPKRHPIPAVGKSRRLVAYGGGHVEVWCQCVAQRSLGIHNKQQLSPDIYFLKFVGAAGRAESVTEFPLDLWNDLSGDIWAMNPPGYGCSTGRASLKTWAGAAMAVFEQLSCIASTRPIVIFANSLGTAVAFHIAARANVAGLICRNPPPLPELIAGRFGWWNLGLGSRLIAAQVPDALDSIRTATKCRVPAVFVTSAKDRTVPAQYQQQILDVYAGPHRNLLLPNAGHGTPMTPDEISQFREHLEWLRRRIF